MTARCRIVIILGILGLVLGALRNQTALTGVSLAILVWLFIVWFHFQLRLWISWPRLTLQRSVNGVHQRKTTLWADRVFTMRVELSGGTIPAFAVMRDLLPSNLRVTKGQVSRVLNYDEATHAIEYECCCPSAGMASFFGVHFEFQDQQGLFVAERVLRDGSQYRVLPAYTQVKDVRSHIKRINSIPQQGIHQLRRAGLGSELLELREYQPGDPPKSIAWKVSARRGELMTRQYESEVPVRITLMVDSGDSMRKGVFGRRALDQVMSMAATVTKTAVSVGDSVGLVLLDSQVRRRQRPAAGDRAFYRILEALAEFSNPATSAAEQLTDKIIDDVSLICRERYPELLERRLETRTFSIFPMRRRKRLLLHQRRQISAVLSELYQLSPTKQVELTYDDRQLTKQIETWLRDQDIFLPSFAAKRRPATVQQSGPQFELLSQELTRAIAYAHDNEVFVVFADLLNQQAHVSELIAATKIAIARHHRVVFICPVPTTYVRTEQYQAPQNINDVQQQVAQLSTSNQMRDLKYMIRGTGAAIAFAGQQDVGALVLAEAELAGSGRHEARALAR